MTKRVERQAEQWFGAPDNNPTEKTSAPGPEFDAMLSGKRIHQGTLRLGGDERNAGHPYGFDEDKDAWSDPYGIGTNSRGPESTGYQRWLADHDATGQHRDPGVYNAYANEQWKWQRAQERKTGQPFSPRSREETLDLSGQPIRPHFGPPIPSNVEHAQEAMDRADHAEPGSKAVWRQDGIDRALVKQENGEWQPGFDVIPREEVQDYWTPRRAAEERYK